MSAAVHSDVDELFLRADASEARQSALESRQARMERLLNDMQVQLQQHGKVLVVFAQESKQSAFNLYELTTSIGDLTTNIAQLNQRISDMAEIVIALKPKEPNGHG